MTHKKVSQIVLSNKEEFRSRPINAFVDIFALSQSAQLVTTSGKNTHLNRNIGSPLNKASRGSGF